MDLSFVFFLSFCVIHVFTFTTYLQQVASGKVCSMGKKEGSEAMGGGQ